MKIISFFRCAAVVCLVGMWGAGCRKGIIAGLDSASGPGSTGDRVVAGHPGRKLLKLYTSQPGKIEAYESTPLVARISGYVEAISVDIGDPVKKGDVLVRLSVPEMLDDLEHNDALVAQAESEIRRSEAAIAAKQAAVRTAEELRGQLLAGVDAAAAVQERWQSERGRIAELVTGGSVTRKLSDEAESQLRAAIASWKQSKAAVSAAEAAIDEAKINVRKAEADLAAVKSQLRVANANLVRSKTMLAYTTIKAPFDGIVTRREIDTGHFVQPAMGGSSKPLLVIDRTDVVRVFVDIPETEAPLVQGAPDGDQATIRVQALGDREFQARVERTGWSLDAANRSLRTEIDVLNTEGALRPGMFATVTILLDTRENALALPATAVLRKGKEFFCCLVDSGKIRRQLIQIGLRCGQDVEIVSGVEDSDVVVLARVESLTDGQAVEVTAPE